ncbi:MAG: cadherin-like domain-containing protein, partial [Desulfuromonas sp.]|nr:cadherin-like domain-containing protein [Desulfuromonas sp.]
MADAKTPTGPIEESIQQAGAENQSAQENTVRGETMAAGMTIPAANAVEVVAVQAGAEVPIAFSLDDVEMTVTGGDLQLDFENGSTLLLQDFATLAAADNPPTLVMADGTMLPGDAVIFSYAGAELAPAAGPALGSGGVGTYRSDMGDTIDGVDRLGVQDPATLATGEGGVLEDDSAVLDEIPPPVATDDDSVLVNEAALDEIQDGYDLAPGTVTGSLPGSTAETDATQTLADNVTDGASPLTYSLVGSPTGTYGTIQINMDGSYTYTLTSPVDGPTADDGANTIDNAEAFTYQVTDAAGQSTTATIYIDIVDDVPTAVIDGPATPAEDTPVTIFVDGNDVEGADGVDWTDSASVYVSSAAAKGTVDYNNDGSFTYTPNAGAEGTDSFSYTIVDEDGDSSEAVVNINLAEDSTPTVSVTDGVVDEAALSDGSDSISPNETTTGTFTITTGNDSGTLSVE